MKFLLILLLFGVVTFTGCKKKCIQQAQSYENQSYIRFELFNPNGEPYFGMFSGAGIDLTHVNMLDEKGNEAYARGDTWRYTNLSYGDTQTPLKPTAIEGGITVDYYNGNSAYADSVGVEINRTFYLKLTKFDTDTIKVKYTLIDACQKTFGRIKVQFNDSTYFDNVVNGRNGACDNRSCYFKFRKK